MARSWCPGIPPAPVGHRGDIASIPVASGLVVQTQATRRQVQTVLTRQLRSSVFFRQACVAEAAATWAEASGAFNLAPAAM